MLEYWYKCSTGHWVSSSLHADLDEKPCPAIMGTSYNNGKADHSGDHPCTGTLGDTMVYLWQILDFLGTSDGEQELLNNLKLAREQYYAGP